MKNQTKMTIRTRKCLRTYMADLLALVCDVYCDLFTSPFGILGQVWYLIALIPDPCCLSYLCIIFWNSKRSLKKRSRLYPEVIPEDDDHHYMDLGDHPLRESVAVELKRVVEHKDGETEYIIVFSFFTISYSILRCLIDFLNKTNHWH